MSAVKKAKPTKKTTTKARGAGSQKTLASQLAQYERVGLMLQGGGALGAYQLGVYRALDEAGCTPDWLCGLSIGAINGALIAGNEPGRRVARLEAFWDRISSPSIFPADSPDVPMPSWMQALSAWGTMTFGQPGFFRPRSVNPWLSQANDETATSLYETEALRATLLELVDFDWLNDRKRNSMRLSVGAVAVETGNYRFFDSKIERIEPAHIMASGALPPALPMVKIGDHHYWDGGIISNTPLQYVLDQEDDLRTLIFQVDLFSARGALPTKMSQVLTRHKDIMYSSRTRQATTAFKRILTLRRQLADALKRVPANKLRAGEAALMHDYADAGVANLVQLIYQGKELKSDNKDYEFSVQAIRTHINAGLSDAKRTLEMPNWFDVPDPEIGVVEHDIHRV